VTDIAPDPSFPGANWNISYANDFALLSVDLGGDTAPYIPLSTHSTSQLEGAAKALNGYPAFIENGAGNCMENSPGWTGDLLFRETGAEMLAATTGLVKTRLDTTGGDSGGPILHLAGGVEFHSAILDGHVASATQWVGGARTSANITFILANP
jgi:hypothetical protein